MNTTWRLRSPKFGDYIEDQSDKEREDMGSEDEEEHDANLVAKQFAEAFDCYKAEILRRYAQNGQVRTQT